MRVRPSGVKGAAHRSRDGLGGSFREPVFTVSWPTGEFGAMGLEGAVRLGFRRELEAISDPAEREAAYETMVARAYERGKALSVATRCHRPAPRGVLLPSLLLASHLVALVSGPVDGIQARLGRLDCSDHC